MLSSCFPVYNEKKKKTNKQNNEFAGEMKSIEERAEHDLPSKTVSTNSEHVEEKLKCKKKTIAPMKRT